MMVAKPTDSSEHDSLEYDCPEPGCRSTQYGPFTGSASKIMRHLKIHPRHAGVSVTVILFAVCQRSVTGYQRFTYISDEYGLVGHDHLVKTGFHHLNLHPSIGASPVPTRPSVLGSRPADEDVGGPCKKSKPASPEPAGQQRSTADSPQYVERTRWAEEVRINREQARIGADKWAEQASFNADQTRTHAEQTYINAEQASFNAKQTRAQAEQAGINSEQASFNAEQTRTQAEQARINSEQAHINAEQASFNQSGQQFMQEQDARNEASEKVLLALIETAKVSKQSHEASMAVLDAKYAKLANMRQRGPKIKVEK